MGFYIDKVQKGKMFLALSGLVIILLLSILIFHFDIIIVPVIAFVVGIIIRYIFKKNYLIVFSFLFPVLSGFASFENHGMPLNYLLLPLILLVGIYVGEIFLDRENALNILKNINLLYFLLLIIIFISFLFLMLRWSNLTLSLSALFKNTPISPQQHISFAIIFPLMFISLFFISYLFYLYLKREKNREKIIVAFLFGHSISIFVLFLQKYFHVKLFLGHKAFNGLASDASSFGFLNSIAFLLAFYLIVKKKNRIFGYIFMIISFFGIIHSQTRTALIPIFFILLYFFIKLSWKKKLLLFVLILFFFINFLYYYYNSDLNVKLRFVNEIENSFWNSFKVLINKSEENTELKNISSKRDLLWGYSIKIIKQYPLIGVGTGNFVFFVMYDNYEKAFFHDLPGNQYLFFSSSIGLIGLIVFLMFLINIMRKKRGIELYILICVLIIMFFGNYMWIPECFLAFWLILSLGEEKQGIKVLKNKKYSFLIYGVIIVAFIISNIYHFNDLHPKTWAKNTGTDYDYDFWYKEKNKQGEDFKWTKDCAGQYIYLDKNGESKDIKLFCGAPLHKIKGKVQNVDIYWKRRLYKNIKFRENRELKFKIKGNPFEEGFFEIRVHPCFNLKKMNLSEESRDLGVQFF